jgi:hypothetical protein
MLTNGNGSFRCECCGYRDKQDVKKLVDAGLDYPVPPSERGKKLKLGGTA